MTEINKTNVNANPAIQPKVIQNKDTDKVVENKQPVENKDYKEAAAAPGAEAAGRAQLMLNKTGKTDKVDNIENDVNKIIKNPKLLDDSNAMFNAAEKAGVPYPQAATFATQELTK